MSTPDTETANAEVCKLEQAIIIPRRKRMPIWLEKKSRRDIKPGKAGVSSYEAS